MKTVLFILLCSVLVVYVLAVLLFATYILTKALVTRSNRNVIEKNQKISK